MQNTQNQDNLIQKLKADLFDSREQIAELGNILQAIVDIMQIAPNEEGNVTPQMLVDAIAELAKQPDTVSAE